MSAQHYFEALHPDTHEHSGGLAEYRELANRCIEDALRCLGFAEQYQSRLDALASRSVYYDQRYRWKHIRDAAAAHERQIESDVEWFRAPDGYAFWVAATHLTDQEAEAVRTEYLRRAEPVLETFRAANARARAREFR